MALALMCLYSRKGILIIIWERLLKHSEVNNLHKYCLDTVLIPKCPWPQSRRENSERTIVPQLIRVTKGGPGTLCWLNPLLVNRVWQYLRQMSQCVVQHHWNLRTPKRQTTCPTTRSTTCCTTWPVIMLQKAPDPPRVKWYTNIFFVLKCSWDILRLCRRERCVREEHSPKSRSRCNLYSWWNSFA